MTTPETKYTARKTAFNRDKLRSIVLGESGTKTHKDTDNFLVTERK
jgi:hypothetical protein